MNKSIEDINYNVNFFKGFLFCIVTIVMIYKLVFFMFYRTVHYKKIDVFDRTIIDKKADDTYSSSPRTFMLKKEDYIKYMNSIGRDVPNIIESINDDYKIIICIGEKLDYIYYSNENKPNVRYKAQVVYKNSKKALDYVYVYIYDHEKYKIVYAN